MLLLQAEGHVKAECRALLKKKVKALTVTLADIVDISFPNKYAPFVSSGIIVSLLCSSEKTSVPILQDTSAAQSLILENVLPFFRKSANGEVMLQRVELGHVSVPLHNIYLHCDLVVSPVTVAVQPLLPRHGSKLGYLIDAANKHSNNDVWKY